MGFNCFKAKAPLRRQFIFTTKFPEIPGTLLSTSEVWKAESTLHPPSGFQHWKPGLAIQRLDHLTTNVVNANGNIFLIDDSWRF